MPVPSIRHSAGGELVVIKQKIIGGKEREREKGAEEWDLGEKAITTLISGLSMACLSFKSLRLNFHCQ